MARQTVRIEGLRELERALKELPKATGKNVLRRVLRKRAEPIAAAAKLMAPDDPNTGGNDLRGSIAVGTKLSKHQAGLHRKMFKDDRASAEVFVGAGNVPHAHMVEFGSVNNDPPRPFMRSAWDAGKAAVLEGIRDDLWTEIDKSAKRLARKQARAAAKAAG